jgi:3D (Asp-Asp-Asp) domain-containing protein
MKARLPASARAVVLLAPLVAACATAGSSWMAEPATSEDVDEWSAASVSVPKEGAAARLQDRFATRTLGKEEPALVKPEEGVSRRPIAGRVIGTFRNTYYDFPAESEHSGEDVTVRDAKCGAIAAVPRGFYEALCVQGSGMLRSGRPVGFARRDCECAEVCPRTGQRICFESLEPSRFPWGRGALGKPITPLVTVAVDDSIIPMGTGIYVPEFDGLPVDAARTRLHDGCFVAEDRGLKVKGQHIDVFTGASETTGLWNRLVPSNRGITVVLDNPRCARAAIP